MGDRKLPLNSAFGQTTVFQSMAELDKGLLLLGMLLNKTTQTKGAATLPCAVVQPQVKVPPAGVQPISPKKFDPQALLSSGESGDENSRKRKRSGSNNLSEEEKIAKRKLTNRVAAQNARDRRKQYVEDLEKKVAALEAKNKQLLEENHSLKERTGTLMAEKQELKEQLTSQVPSDLLELRALVKESLLESAGSAVPTISLQQKQIPVASLAQAWILSFVFSPLQYDLLYAGLYGNTQSTSPTPESCDFSGESCDPTVARQPSLENPSMVGSWAGQVAPTQELCLVDRDESISFDSPTEHFFNNLCTSVCDTSVDSVAPDVAGLGDYGFGFEVGSCDPDLERLFDPIPTGLSCDFDIESLLA